MVRCRAAQPPQMKLNVFAVGTERHGDTATALAWSSSAELFSAGYVRHTCGQSSLTVRTATTTRCCAGIRPHPRSPRLATPGHHSTLTLAGVLAARRRVPDGASVGAQCPARQAHCLRHVRRGRRRRCAAAIRAGQPAYLTARQVPAGLAGGPDRQDGGGAPRRNHRSALEHGRVRHAHWCAAAAQRFCPPNLAAQPARTAS